MAALLSLLVLYTCVARVNSAYVMYDFESATLPSGISSSGTGSTPPTISSNIRYKHGSKSLKWEWTSDNRLEFDLSGKNIRGSDTRVGGMKLHMYNTGTKSGKCLTLCTKLDETAKIPLPSNCPPTLSSINTFTSCFRMSLDFQGWRTVWVKYTEFKGCPFTSATAEFIPPLECFDDSISQIKKFYIDTPSVSATTSHSIFIDFVEFVDEIEDESRDHIVPPIKNFDGTSCVVCDQFDGITERDAVARFDQTRFWQQAYRWYVKSKTPTPLPSAVDNAKITQIELIEKRLVNWYAREETAYFDLHRNPPGSSPYLKKRWESLLNKINKKKSCNMLSGNIECAHQLFTTLRIHPATKKGASLFCRNCKFSPAINGELKFKDVFQRILLPLAMDYHIWSRVKLASCELAKIYRCGTPPSMKDLEAITSKDADLLATFIIHFGASIPPTGPSSSLCSGVKEVCFQRFKSAIEALNIERKNKIMLLFDYVKDQGFAKGSGLGSLDHEMLSGSGFVHAAFLMRKELETAGKLRQTIDTIKWYSDFGEIYQSNFEYKGTTSDRVRTTLMFRLLTVVAMPQSNEAEKKAKLRDMESLKNWIDNAFTVNEGLLGLIKPDYLGFHHSIVYEGAYVPDALHTASLVSYFLSGTNYQLSTTSISNIENGLKLLRIIAVKYSIPPSVNGRYPDYGNARLGKELPAYAYMAINSPNLTPSGNLQTTALKMDKTNAKMFLRLYEFPSSPVCPVDTNLCNGRLGHITYLNTLGAAQILEDIKTVASYSPIVMKEDSPSGSWAKNYAALSIHRRNNWIVTVKGFNNFVYGPERYHHSNENVYGMFANHGAMLIANDEESLSSKDVKNVEWDWTKIPGTTAIQLFNTEIEDITGSRYSNPHKLAGGVTFQGSSVVRQSNGVFGMDFSQPRYATPKAHPLHRKMFEFKKSVFFFNDYLVAVGSGISSTATREIRTTLFQDKVTGSTPSLIPPLPTSSPSLLILRCNDPGLLNRDFASSASPDVMLVDAHGNRYYVPNPTAQQLVVREDASSSYCRAWFNHGINPTSPKKYKYMVDVNAEPVSTGSSVAPKSLLTARVYTVLKDNTDAHVVRFDGSSPVTYGYVIFQGHAMLPVSSPVMFTSAECLMMAKETANKLYLSISYPHLNLATVTPHDPNQCAYCPDVVSTTTPAPIRAADAGSTYLFCAESQPKSIGIRSSVLLDRSSTIDSIKVNGEVIASANHPTYLSSFTFDSAYTDMRFYNLKKGFTTEVTLNK